MFSSTNKEITNPKKNTLYRNHNDTMHSIPVNTPHFKSCILKVGILLPNNSITGRAVYTTGIKGTKGEATTATTATTKLIPATFYSKTAIIYHLY